MKDKTIGDVLYDEFRSGISTPDGGYLLAGTSSSTISPYKSDVGKGGLDYWIVKTDGQYNKLWDRVFGGDLNEHMSKVISTPDGGYLLGGYSYSGISGDKSEANKGLIDYWVVKIDNQGNKAWDKSFGGDAEDYLYNMVTTPDGGYLLGGYSYSGASGDKSENGKGGSDFWVIKIDNQGNKVWDKTIGGGSSDVLSSIVAAEDGWLLFGASGSDVSGDKSENSKGQSDYWVVKIDSQGSKLWDKTIGGSGSEEVAAAIPALGGGYLLTGSSNSNISGDKSENNKGNSDFWAVKIDAGGNIVWDRTFGGPDSDMATCAASTPDGGYLLGGRGGSSEIDYWIVKVDQQGVYDWDKLVGGTSYDYLVDIIITPDGNYLLAGTSYSGRSRDKSEDSIGGCDHDEQNNIYCTNDYWIVELDAPDIPIVTDFTLMNAHTDQEIKALNDGDVIRLTETGTSLLDVRADITANNITKVEFELNGPVTHHQIERQAPYALFGNQQNDFNGRKLLPGAYTLKVTPFINDQAQTTVIVSFTVTSGITFTLMNAHTDQEIRELKDGDEIRLADTGRLLDIRANITANNITKVVLQLNGPVTHHQTERQSPYALFGNQQNDFNGRKLLPGAYTLKVTPFVHDQEQAAVVISFTVTPGITFTLMNAHTDQEIQELKEGDEIRLTDTGRLLDIRANITANNITKVVFQLKGPVTHHQIERQSPYALFGNQQSDFNGRKLLPGQYSLKVTPYINDIEATGITIAFTVTDGFGITGFTLIDASLDQPIRAFTDGDFIDLWVFQQNLTIRADTDPMHIERVDFELQGPMVYSKSDRAYPYVLFGEITNNGVTDFFGADLVPGRYTLSATPYANGQAGSVVTIAFNAVKKSPNTSRETQVYPIPASDVVNIRHEVATGQAYISLIDLYGNVLVNRPMGDQPVEQLDVSKFRKGIYYLKITGWDKPQIIRLVLE